MAGGATILAPDTSDGRVPTGEWVHVCIVYDADGSGGGNPDLPTVDYVIYKNGSSIASGSGYSGTFLDSNTGAVYVGNQPSGATVAPDGRLADVAVWSVTLSSSEVAALAAKTSRPSDYSTGLQGYLKFDGSTDFSDYSGNSRTATNNGTDWSTATPGFSAGGSKVPLFNNYYF